MKDQPTGVRAKKKQNWWTKNPIKFNQNSTKPDLSCSQVENFTPQRLLFFVSSASHTNLRRRTVRHTIFQLFTYFQYTWAAQPKIPILKKKGGKCWCAVYDDAMRFLLSTSWEKGARNIRQAGRRMNEKKIANNNPYNIFHIFSQQLLRLYIYYSITRTEGLGLMGGNWSRIRLEIHSLWPPKSLLKKRIQSQFCFIAHLKST